LKINVFIYKPNNIRLIMKLTKEETEYFQKQSRKIMKVIVIAMFTIIASVLIKRGL